MAESNKRIYLVTEEIEGTPKTERLINAASQAQAISHVVKGRFVAASAKTGDVARILTAGGLVQEAGEE